MVKEIINNDSNIYLYNQVEKIIKQDIIDGKLEYNEKLPSELELCEKFGVSRITIRKAIHELENQGYVIAKPGRGTFVIEKVKKDIHLLDISGFSDGIGNNEGKLKFTKKVINKEIISSTESEQDIFERDYEFKLVKLERVIYLENKGFGVDISFFPTDIYPEIISYIEDEISTFDLVLNKYHIVFKKAKKEFQVVKAPSSLASYLEIPNANDLIKVNKTIWDQYDRVVHYSTYYLLPDEVKFSFEVNI